MSDHLKPSGASTADSEKTAAVSKAPSMDYEKTDAFSAQASAREPSAEPQTAPGTANSKEQAAVVNDEDHADEEVENEDDYPKAWRLGAITIALCLSVFCMALVRLFILVVISTLAKTLNRTTPLSLQPFRASQINSRLSTT